MPWIAWQGNVENVRSTGEGGYKSDVSQWQFAANKPNDLPQQSNSFACGFFISLYTRCLVGEGVMLSDEQSISDFRKHTLLELHSQSLI